MMKITNQHRLFIEAYDGNASLAMRKAGFQGSDQELEMKGSALLRNPTILEALKVRSRYLASTAKLIATRDERQAFWTAIMRNEDPNARPELNDKGVAKIPDNVPMPMRLKASELLGKSETDFIEKIDVHHNLSITDIIKESYSIEDDNLEAIEVEYELMREKKTEAIKTQSDEFKSDMVVNEDERDINVGDNVHGSTLGDFL